MVTSKCEAEIRVFLTATPKKKKKKERKKKGEKKRESKREYE